MSSSRSMPVWLRWVLGTLGGAIVLAALWRLSFTVIDFWHLAHSTAGLMAKSGQLLAKILGVMTGEIIVIMVGGWLLSLALKKKEQSPASMAAAARATPAAPAAVAKPAQRISHKRWQSATVLEISGEFRKLWGFNSSKRGFSLSQENSLSAADSLPAKLVAKNWKSLFQPRLNVALLPADQVFLRVIQLPIADFDETLQMVELQLEKFSPLPVTQICWSIHTLPHHVENLQTVIITIVGRDHVQEYLGNLEKMGFLADRLELPMVDQLQATPITGDGAWVYPGADPGKFSALVAWWYGGVLRNLALFHVPAAENRIALFKEQINQMVWAGELEGWLSGSPQWHLVADEPTAANWLPLFKEGLGQTPEVIQPLAESDLAAMTANRAAHASPRSNVLPVEYSTRYHQQFVDGLWMRGVGTAIMGYLGIVIIYMAIAGWQGMSADSVERDMRNLSGQYTNTLQLKAKVQVLQDRQDLKNAALEVWKLTAEKLPEGLTIQSLELKGGKAFTLYGNAPREAETSIDDFNDQMRKATVMGRQFFSKMEIATTHPGAGGMTWSFSGELARVEEPTP